MRLQFYMQVCLDLHNYQIVLILVNIVYLFTRPQLSHILKEV